MIVDPTKEFRIYTQNCIDSASSIVSSHGGTTASLYDFDPTTKWTTSGAKRDTIPASLTITFKVGTTETPFTINSLLLLNTNAKKVMFEYYTAGNYVELFTEDIDVSRYSDTRCFYFGAVLTSRIRVTIYDTQSAHNQEKYIGTLIVARLRVVPTQTPSTYDQTSRDKRQTLELGNGDRRVYINRFTTNRTQKWGARIGFNFLTAQDIYNLKYIKDEAQPFLCQPEALTSPEDIYLVNWVSNFTPTYTAQNKVVGFDLVMELEEV